MKNPLLEKISKWDEQDTNDPKTDFSAINLQIEYLHDKLFYYYEPVFGPHPDFWSRLSDWLNNSDKNEDQQNLFRLIPRMFFVGRGEIDTLYRVAHNGSLARWLLKLLNVKLDDPNAGNIIKASVDSTWFCPITDSMRINAYYHVNNVTSGVNYRPDWHSLCRFASESRIMDYIKKKGIKRIVLLEDFIGSGEQSFRSVEYAASLSLNIPILVLPLIICPEGESNGKELEQHYPNLTFSPVISLRQDAFINQDIRKSEPSLDQLVRELSERLYSKVSGRVWPHHPGIKPYGPYGFHNTGGLIITYANCPDNTLPIVHHKHDSWNPLFPRSTRL